MKKMKKRGSRAATAVDSYIRVRMRESRLARPRCMVGDFF